MLQKRVLGYLAAILGIAAVTAICALLRSHINEMTVALAMLLVVLFVAAAWGRWPGLVASVLGMLCLNYFFLPPIYTFTIADPKNWIALTAFFITALTAGQLSDWVKQRAAEAEASRSQARLASAYNRSLIEASLDPLVTIGHDGKINDVNAAAETVTGRSRAELIGTDFSDYFTEPDQARAGYQQAFREGLVRDYPLEIRHRDGHTTPVLYNASVYRDETGGITGVFAAARDVTERKQAENEIRLLARLQAVVAELGQEALRSEPPARCWTKPSLWSRRLSTSSIAKCWSCFRMAKLCCFDPASAGRKDWSGSATVERGHGFPGWIHAAFRPAGDRRRSSDRNAFQRAAAAP